MSQHTGRFAAAASARTAEGWRLERLTPPSRLFGANGLRTGADGRLYVAQVSGSQVSAISLVRGEIAASSAVRSIAPLAKLGTSVTVIP